MKFLFFHPQNSFYLSLSYVLEVVAKYVFHTQN
jgi:hypothetical protein